MATESLRLTSGNLASPMFSFLKRRRWLFGLFLLVSLVVGEFWLYAANRLGGYLHEKTFGGASMADFCESSTVAGFPFRLRLSCSHFSAPLRTGGGDIIVKAEETHGQASIFAPNHIVLTLSSPLSLQKADGAPFAKLRHDGLTLDVAWTSNGLDKASLDITALDWRPEAPDAGIAFNVQKLSVLADWVAGADGGSVRFNMTGDGLTAPALQALLNKTDLGRVTVGGVLHPAPTMAANMRDAAEDWRQKSGALGIERMEWSLGDASLSAEGALILDEAHRPAGRLNLAAQGAGPILSRLGLPPALAQAQVLIGALFGKPAAAKTEDAKAQDDNTLRLPLILAKGQVSLGPMRLPFALAPLY
jgi:hypothetical protein